MQYSTDQCVTSNESLKCRWVYADGLKTGTFTAHSVILCFMVGPLGLLSHVITNAAVRAWRRMQGGEADNSVVYHF